jgi:hypothetical protein
MDCSDRCTDTTAEKEVYMMDGGRTRDEVPGVGAGVEAIVLAGLQVHAGLLQRLLHGGQVRVRVVRVAGHDDGLAGHAGSAYEEDVVVCDGGHLKQRCEFVLLNCCKPTIRGKLDNRQFERLD